MRRTFLALGLALAAAAPLSGASARAASIEALSFVSGRWRGETDGLIYEENWLEPEAGVMTGMFRMYKGDTLNVLEYMVVHEEDDVVTFRMKHFNADYSTWESDGPIVLQLAETGEGSAVFRAIDDDAHVRSMRYARDGDGNLNIAVEVMEDDGPDSFAFSFAPVVGGDGAE